MAISVTDLTNSVTTDSEHNVTGGGIFDNLMETVNTHIKAQFDADRIKESDIANMYVGIMPAVLAESMKFVLQKDIQVAQEAELVAKTAREDADSISKIAVQSAQRALYDRQRAGFDDNKNQKLFETQMNAWSLMYSSGILPEKPTIIEDQEASRLYNYLIADLQLPDPEADPSDPA